MTFVVVPEYIARTWWERALYNQAAKQLRTALLGRPHTAVITAAYRRTDADADELPPDEVPTGVLYAQRESNVGYVDPDRRRR